MVEDAEYLSALLGLAESALLLQDRTGAAVLRDLLLPHADLWIVDGIGAACWGLVGEWLARIEDLLGHPDEGARLRAGAAERYRSAGAVGPLRRLSETGRGGSAAQQVGELCREPGGWVVSWNGQSTVLPDLKGLRDLQLLVTRPGTALSSLALLAGSAGLPVPVSTGSDEVLDDRARAAYRRRLRELEDEMAEAAAVGDAVRAERAQEERDFLVRELAAALGLGGRSRRLGDETDRARKAVTMRVRDVIGRLDGPLPDLALHLRDSVRTGRECVYAPDTAVAWRTSSSERVTES